MKVFKEVSFQLAVPQNNRSGEEDEWNLILSKETRRALCATMIMAAPSCEAHTITARNVTRTNEFQNKNYRNVRTKTK